MKGRKTEREGRHVSVSGGAADEVLDTLVKQFADPYAFVRELIQNSLDAGAARIDIRMTYDGRELRVEVVDDGEGMDRPIIEGYLLTLFRSTKEADRTKIGKFGIGFTSIFAMEPYEVVVDTGRDGTWHRVTFDHELSYTLSRLDDPFEGTTVTLRLARSRRRAIEDTQAIRAAAERWCRYADAAITLSAEGTDDDWGPIPLVAPFTVDAPVVVVEETDGFRAVFGPHPAAAPPIGFYNRGITLWEAHEAAVPGVTFRVAGRHLEHTLTRDNVIRDRHYGEVMDRLRGAARVRLAAAIHAEAEAAARTVDLPRSARLFAAIAAEVAWEWREDAALLPGHGRALSLAELRGSRVWVDRIRGAAPRLWWAPPGCPVGAALAAGGTPVVIAEAPDTPHLLWAARTLAGEPRAARDGWLQPAPARVTGGVAALFAATAGMGAPPLVPALFRGRGEALEGRLAVALPDPWALLPSPLPAPRGTVLVAADHPLVAQLAELGAELGAPLLVHAALAAAGVTPPSGFSAADQIAGAHAGELGVGADAGRAEEAG